MSDSWCEPPGSWISNAIPLSAYTILYHDYLLTLSKEVDGYWSAGSRTWMSILFLVNRYAAVLGHLPLFYVILGDPCKTEHIAVDRKLYRISLSASYHSILILVLTTLTTVLLAMRVYAFYYRNKWVLGVVMTVVIAGSSIACWSLTRLLPGGAVTETPESAYRKPVAVAFSGLLVFDFTVFILTVARSLHLWNSRWPFLRQLFVDGLLYSGVICSLNLLNIIVLVGIEPRIDLSTPIFTNVLSVVMISRIMINLRDPTLHKPADSDGTVTTAHVGYISTVVLGDTLSTMVETMPESTA